MNSQTIAHTDLEVSRLSYGCMRIAGTWNPAEIDTPKREAAHRAILAAYEAGYTLFDHADIYCAGGCEMLHGEVMRAVPSMRNQIVIATKCGIRFPGDPTPAHPHRYDFSKQHILASCDRSLERLGIETIDIYQLHRPDLLMNPAEVAEAFDELHRSGKVRYFGVSNFLPSFVRALQAHLDFPLVVNQVEIHLGRLDCLVDGTLDQCLEMGLTPLSWSPLGGGWLGDARPGQTPTYSQEQSRVLAAIDAIALATGATRTQVSLAWLLKHPSQIIPIVGSTDPDRIRSAAVADDVELSREDWYRLLVAARGKPMP
jgi:predicted oxidoreductase